MQEECTGGWLDGVRGKTKRLHPTVQIQTSSLTIKYIFLQRYRVGSWDAEKAGGTLKRIQSKVVSLMRPQGEWHVPALKSDFSLWRTWLYEACIFYTVFTKMYVVVKINELQKKSNLLYKFYFQTLKKKKKRKQNTQHPFCVCVCVLKSVCFHWEKTHMTVYS